MKAWRVLIVAWVLCISMGGAAEWRAGVARVEITPAEPTWMAGFASRNRPAEGALHSLWAKALVIEHTRGGRVAIVATDLIGLSREVSDAVGARVREQTGIPRERLVLNSSHTHCGPVVRGCAPIAYHLDAAQTAVVDKYADVLVERLALVVQKASAAMQPAELRYGEGKATFAMNRRSVRNGQYVIAPNPDGPVEHAVPVLQVKDTEGRLLAVLFGYACHNTTVGSDCYQYHGDYAGFAQIALEKEHPGTAAMFVIGCGADSNPDPRGSLALAERHGGSLAAAVKGALAGSLRPVRGPLGVHFTRVDLPLVAPPTKAELEQRRNQGSPYQKRLAGILLKRLEQQGKPEESYPCPVQVVRFGEDLTLVALAGEVTVDYALRLRREVPGNLWVAGYSNEVFAYVPSERVLSEGGYEGGDAMVYFGLHGPFRPGVEDRIVDTVKRFVSATDRSTGQAPAPR